MEDQNPNVLKTIHQILTKNGDTITETINDTIEVSIFKAPTSLSESKPEAYVPQLIGLGPYNHFRAELQQLQTLKLNVVRRVRQKFYNDFDFDTLVKALRGVHVASAARASYASYLDMDNEALTCLVAIDGLYLYKLLRCCVDNDRAGLDFFHLFAGFIQGSESSRVITIRDALMLENQIPIFALRAIITAEHCDYMTINSKGSLTFVTKSLPELLLEFAKTISPLKVLRDYPLYKVSQHSHLLDLLYSLITLKISPIDSYNEEKRDEIFVSKLAERLRKEIYGSIDLVEPFSGSAATSGHKILLDELILHIAEEAMEYIPPGLDIPVKIMRALIRFPWSKLWSFFRYSLGGEHGEEVLIPRASELSRKGIKFCGVDRIHDVKFDREELSLHLPLIKLDATSEVVLRNLVAYEAMTQPEGGSLVLARYLELMSALLKSSEDVKSLSGTIIERSSLCSTKLEDGDEEVVKLFGGMSKALRPTNTPDLDRAIADVKGYYDGLWSVYAGKFIKKWGQIVLSWFFVLALLLVCLALFGWALFLVYEWLFSRKTSGAQIHQAFNDLGLPSRAIYQRLSLSWT